MHTNNHDCVWENYLDVYWCKGDSNKVHNAGSMCGLSNGCAMAALGVWSLFHLRGSVLGSVLS